MSNASDLLEDAIKENENLNDVEVFLVKDFFFIIKYFKNMIEGMNISKVLNFRT